MSYYPTFDELTRLGFISLDDENGDAMTYIDKGQSPSGLHQMIELVNDEGVAMLMEWVDGEPRAWTACEDFEALSHLCETSFYTPTNAPMLPL